MVALRREENLQTDTRVQTSKGTDDQYNGHHLIQAGMVCFSGLRAKYSPSQRWGPWYLGDSLALYLSSLPVGMQCVALGSHTRFPSAPTPSLTIICVTLKSGTWDQTAHSLLGYAFFHWLSTQAMRVRSVPCHRAHFNSSPAEEHWGGSQFGNSLN
jgi:hypothetical protein